MEVVPPPKNTNLEEDDAEVKEPLSKEKVQSSLLKNKDTNKKKVYSSSMD
jgi:hypothetical protein